MTITHNNKSDELGRPAGGCTHGRGFTIAWQDGPLGRDRTKAEDDERLTLLGRDRTGEEDARFAEMDAIERKEPNGAFVEDIIVAARGRLEFYQASEFASPNNASAIDLLTEALHCLHLRTANREARGVEGTHER